MERLQKVIANSGYTSRRKAEQLILEGRVKVNGVVVRELGTKVKRSDTIDVEGMTLEKENKVYYLFYKPQGVISAVSDDKGRPVVTDYFQGIPERIYPVGRLDYDTTGILLLTNDGEFTNMMTHPKMGIEKVYRARVRGLVRAINLKKLERGVDIGNYKTAPAKAKIRDFNKKNDSTLVELTIHEGKYHQVKKMFDAIGHPVKKLKRIRYGYLELGTLKPGEYRRLKPHEVKQLKVMSLSK